jgi:hypothetical protein
MGNRNRGIYNKFRVERVDGKSASGKKHAGCDYFVLDITHDPHAIPALLAYAESASRDDYELLALDIVAKVGAVTAGAVPQRSSSKSQGEHRRKSLKD